jgi:hypothetical protein
MTKRFPAFRALVQIVAAAGGLCAAASAQIVAVGTDYLTTGAGTQFNIPGIGVVQFKGNPIPNLGSTDTVVERQEDADLAPGQATIPIQVTQLSLESTGPVAIGGNSCNVFVVLDPANLARDVGQMTIFGAPPYTSGTFDSTFILYFEVTFLSVTTGQTCRSPFKSNCQFGLNSTPWQSATLPSQFLKTGPDNCTPTNPPTSGHCLGTKDQIANKHQPLAKGAVDFYPVNAAIHVASGGQHVVSVACEKSGSQGPCQP